MSKKVHRNDKKNYLETLKSVVGRSISHYSQPSKTDKIKRSQREFPWSWHIVRPSQTLEKF